MARQGMREWSSGGVAAGLGAARPCGAASWGVALRALLMHGFNAAEHLNAHLRSAKREAWGDTQPERREGDVSRSGLRAGRGGHGGCPWRTTDVVDSEKRPFQACFLRLPRFSPRSCGDEGKDSGHRKAERTKVRKGSGLRLSFPGLLAWKAIHSFPSSSTSWSWQMYGTFCSAFRACSFFMDKLQEGPVHRRSTTAWHARSVPRVHR